MVHNAFVQPKFVQLACLSLRFLWFAVCLFQGKGEQQRTQSAIILLGYKRIGELLGM